MSRDYALSRVKDALEKSDGNHLKAQRLLLQWLEKGQTLLVGLAGPHLSSIVTHAIAHVTTPPKKINPKEYESDEFGSAMLESLSAGGADNPSFGQAPTASIPKPGQTSRAHVDPINKIARASKNKGDGGKSKK